MTELIGIREASRRIGVSDTAVHKAIRAGRVKIAGRTPVSGRPLVAWPQVLEDWKSNSDAMKRSHVGPRGATSKPAVLGVSGDGGDAAPPSRPARAAAAAPLADVPEAPQTPAPGGGPSYAQSRAAREAYAAALLKLELQEKRGQLVSVDMVKTEAFKAHRRIRDAMLNIPDRCSNRLSTMSDAGEVHAYLLTEINAALRLLAADLWAPTAA